MQLFKTYTYTLDEQGTPVPEPDMIKWSSWFGNIENRRIAAHDVGDIHISTVFLAMLHPNDMLFETMVFADVARIARLLELSESEDRSLMAMFLGSIDIQKRYRTRNEALEGHKKMCEFVEVCVAKGLLKQKEM